VSGCRDWSALAAERDTIPLADPAGWDEARAHLAGCEACRRAALAADPLFLFAALPPSAVPPAEWGASARRATAIAANTDASDASEMTSAVLALVRASRVAAPADRPLRRGAASMRWAAALVVASLFALSGAPRSPRPPIAVAVEAPAPGGEMAGFGETVDFVQPMVEELDRPEARVYELSNADLAVVMIVDAGLDV